MPGKLYLVGTPIGNLGDMAPRAVEALRGADFVAAEDTRVSMKLFNRFGIKKPLLSYHEHNSAFRGTEIVSRILQGETCALITDAGMPAISDPGQPLVADCVDKGIDVVCVCGPNAAVAALAVSGLPCGRFCFEGFLSTSRKNRFKHLSDLKNERRTMVFYEAPHKLKNTLKDMLDAFGDRRVAVCRELTKLHEQKLYTTLSGAVGYFDENAPRGEFVLVVEGAAEAPESACSLRDALFIAKRYVSEGRSTKDAAKSAAQETGVNKNVIYDGILKED